MARPKGMPAAVELERRLSGSYVWDDAFKALVLAVHQEYFLTRDAQLLDLLGRVHFSLARHCAGRYYGRGVPMEDLQSIALLGLAKALDKYDPSRGEFGAFAWPSMHGEIKRYFRDHSRTVRSPRRLQELNMAIRLAREILWQQIGEVTVENLALYLGVDEDEVQAALTAEQTTRGYESLQGSIRTGEDLTWLDTIGENDPGMAAVNSRLALEAAMAHLTERESRVLRLHFFEGLTQQQVGQIIGCSQMHVSRLIRQAVGSLRAIMGAV